MERDLAEQRKAYLKESREAKIRQAVENAKECKMMGYHCSESTIRACSKALGLNLSDDVLRSACGFRGGGGGYMDRCGVVEAGCMLISYIFGRLTPEEPDWRYSYLICLFHDRFMEHFGSIECRDILPVERKNTEIPVCMRIYAEGSEILTKFILEAPELLEKAPEEVRIFSRLWFPFKTDC